MSIPHLGTKLPNDILPALTNVAKRVPDTDWDLDRLYEFAEPLGAHSIAAHYSRYVVDLNRPGDGSSLYPGQTTTELVPTQTFAGEPLYTEGRAPDEQEIARRKESYWRPYHQKIEDTLAAIKARHGFAILFDCHSIKSEVPRLFEGKLSDLNLGTADGTTCCPTLRQVIVDAMARQTDLSVTIDGRFKGGFITRNYGRPNKNIHAYQIEHSTAIYMDEQPEFEWNEDKAAASRPALKEIFKAVMLWTYLQSLEGKAT